MASPGSPSAGRAIVTSATFRTWRGWLAVIPVAAYVVASLPHLDFVPLWDGLWYATCVSRSQQWLVRFLAGCYGHATQGWSAPFVLALHLFPASHVAINVVQIALGAAGVFAFHRLLATLWPDREAAVVNALVATVFATNPIVVGNLLNLTPDNGVLVYFLFVALFLARGRVIAAMFAGVLLVLSKETGAVYYTVIAALWCAWRWRQMRAGESWRELFRDALLLAVPLIVFAGAVVGKHIWFGRAGWAGTVYLRDVLSELVPRLDDGVFPRLLAAIFVMNFAWVSTLIVAGEVVRRAVAGWQGTRHDGDQRRLVLILGLLVLFVWISTRFLLQHPAPRYILICLPLTALALRECLASVSWSRLRVAIPAVVVLLNVASLSRTIDPLSVALLGTFPVGARQMLDPVTLPWTYHSGTEGQRREELIYNLEFTNIHRVFNEVLATHCTSDCQLLTQLNRGAEDYGTVENGLSRRAFPGHGTPAACQAGEAVRTIRKDHMSEDMWQPSSPCLVYVTFPHCPWADARFFRAIAGWGYTRTDSDTVTVNGYSANVLTYRLDDIARK